MLKKKMSNNQEKRITRSLNEIKEASRQQISSGSLWFAKGDVITSSFLIEAKTKEKASSSITVKKEWLDKIETEAFDVRKIPALAFSFGTQTDYFVLKDKHFIALVEELKELREVVKNYDESKDINA